MTGKQDSEISEKTMKDFRFFIVLHYLHMFRQSRNNHNNTLTEREKELQKKLLTLNGIFLSILSFCESPLDKRGQI